MNIFYQHTLQQGIEFSNLWLIAMSRALWQGTIALALVWLVCKFATRLPARVKSWLWRLAYLKLLLALLWATPMDLALLKPRSVEMPYSPPIVAHENWKQSPGISKKLPATVETQLSAFPMISSPAPRLEFEELLPLAAMALWATGALIFLVRLGIHWHHAIRLRQAAIRSDDPEIDDRFAQIARRLSFRRTPPIFMSDEISGPLLVGVFRPAILLPSLMLDAPPAHLRMILAHELAHLKRNDLPWNVFTATIDAAFFFNPLVWLARRESRLAAEMACDQAALESANVAPREYGQLLLDIATPQIWSSPLAAGVAGTRFSLERRLLAMSHSKIWSRRNLALAGFAVALLGVATLPPWRLVAQTSPGMSSGTSTGMSSPTTQPAPMGGAPQPGGPAVRIDIGPRVVVDGIPPGGAPAAENTLPAGERRVIYAAEAGIITDVNMERAKAVHRGDILLSLDSRRERLAVAQANDKLRLEQMKLDRLQSAMKSKAVPQQELDEQTILTDMAELDLQSKKIDLDDLIIRAPSDGWWSIGRGMWVGRLVTKGETVGQLTNDPPQEMPLQSGRRAAAPGSNSAGGSQPPAAPASPGVTPPNNAP
jgi:beta-lactamase regulating signal transducer with metallopeptidase domain